MAQDSPQSKYSEQYILNQIYDQVLKSIGVTTWGWNGQATQANNADSLTIKLDFDGGANPIYIGVSAPGTATSGALWQIRKITYDGDNPTDIKFSGGTPNFDQIWDNRASLSYS